MWERKMVLGKERMGDGDNDEREEINKYIRECGSTLYLGLTTPYP